MTAIEILGLEKTYSVGFWRKRPKRALHPLHLAVEDGEIFGFLGPNGAGKTTTLKLLMGLVPRGRGKRQREEQRRNPLLSFFSCRFLISATFRDLQDHFHLTDDFGNSVSPYEILSFSNIIFLTTLCEDVSFTSFEP